MQISKKLYATLIITVLTISAIMAAIPMASAEILTPPFLVTKGGTAPVTGGVVGTQADIVGNGTSGAASPFSTVTAYWDALSGAVLGTASADVNGAYRITVTIPPATAGTHYVVVNDGETESEGAAFNVTSRLRINTIPPSFGTPKALPGDTVTVTGDGFAANDDITLFFNSTTLATPNSFVVTSPSISTDSTGSFSATIQIPSTIVLAEFDTYTGNATDEAGNSAVANIIIDYYITCTPNQGPTGITTVISGRIAPNVAYDIRFNFASIASGTTTSDGSYSESYTIPGVLSTGNYAVHIWWATVNNRSTTFTVTPSPNITLTPSHGIAGATIDIDGEGFTPGADITMYFDGTVVNSTAMDSDFVVIGFGPSAGTFALDFVVPSLAPGIYAVTVVDEYGATSSSGVYFTIDPTPVFTIETRSMEYMQDDTISLTSYATSAVDVLLVITDPTGLAFYNFSVSDSWWQNMGGYYELPYDATYLNTYPIPSDAPTGMWNFTAYSPAMVIIDTNLFEVKERATMQTVLDAIDECCENTTDLLMELGANITAIDGTVATISTTVGDINVALTDLDATITSIEDDVVTISTTVGDIEMSIGDLSGIGGTISSIEDDVVTITTTLGTIHTTLDGVDTVVGLVAGDTAYLKSAVTNMTGTITDISDGVATIETDVGTLRMDVADMKTDVADVQTNVDDSLPVTVDMMPVWIAVVLSLIAAIAAIFAVVTIRQKIAG